MVPGAMIAVVNARPSADTRKTRTRPFFRMNRVSTGLCGEYSRSPAAYFFIGAAAPMASILAGVRSRKMSTSAMHQIRSGRSGVGSTRLISSRRPGAHGGGPDPHAGRSMAFNPSVRQYDPGAAVTRIRPTLRGVLMSGAAIAVTASPLPGRMIYRRRSRGRIMA